MLLPGRGPLTIGFLTINVPFNEDTDIYYSKWKEVSKGMAYEWKPGFGKSAHTVRSLHGGQGRSPISGPDPSPSPCRAQYSAGHKVGSPSRGQWGVWKGLEGNGKGLEKSREEGVG